MNYSIVLCTYNGSRYLEEQFKSYSTQSTSPKRIYIFDDLSSDNTVELAKILVDKYLPHTELIIKLNKASKGASKNYLDALFDIKDPIIFISDQDDIWLDDRVDLYKKHERLLLSEQSALIYSDSLVFDEVGTKGLHLDMLGFSEQIEHDDSLLFRNFVQGATICLNQPLLCLYRQIMQDKQDAYSHIAMYDWWLALLAKYHGKLIFIQKPTLLYRQHSDNVVGAKGSTLLGRIKPIRTQSLQLKWISEINGLSSTRKICFLKALLRKKTKNVNPIKKTLMLFHVLVS